MDIRCVSGLGPGLWALWWTSQRSLCSDSLMGKPDIEQERVQLEQTPKCEPFYGGQAWSAEHKDVLDWGVSQSQGSCPESGAEGRLIWSRDI